MKKYSDYFKTLHDETSPTGQLGRGTHYSVIRSVAWQNAWQVPLDLAHYHDLAIIWDEDHDERVIEVIENLYFQGLLSPAVFVGERKGHFSLLINDLILDNLGGKWLHEYRNKVDSITQNLEDCWSSEVHVFNENDIGIINDSHDSVALYLNTIKMLWNLGINER